MEPVGLCGGGLVACLLFMVAVVGSAALAGGIALVLAKLGVTVDRRFKPKTPGEPEHGAADPVPGPADPVTGGAPITDKTDAAG